MNTPAASPIPDMTARELRLIGALLYSNTGQGDTESLALAQRCLETATLLDAVNVRAGGPVLLQTSPTEAVCFNVGGRFHGWLFRQHPDGQWISVRKLEAIEIPLPEVFAAQRKDPA